MDARRDIEAPAKNPTTVERKSEREIVVTRIINGPARLVYEAFTRSDLFQRWWVPKSLGLTLLSCEIDARIGGKYRLVFAHGDSTAEFFGQYLDAVPHSRLVWTNEESGEGGAVTTATFEDKGGKTLLAISNLYPSREALDADAGSTGAMDETLSQLDELLVTLGQSAGR